MTELRPDPRTIYGPRSLVRRYNCMIAATPRMAKRIVRLSGTEKACKLARSAGAYADSLRREWGGSYAAADDDPRIGFFEALDGQLFAATSQWRNARRARETEI